MRPIYEVAVEIADNWPNVNPTALPYLRAMYSLINKDSFYGVEKADEIVLRFLCNAQTFHGEKAKQLKAELRQIIK